MSQHSYGNAIDISSIDGVSIKDSWQEAAKVACKHFTNVLTPASNAAHHDHLHLDNGMGFPCWGKKMSKSLQNWFLQSEQTTKKFADKVRYKAPKDPATAMKAKACNQ